MSIRSLRTPLLAGLSPLALLAGPSFASGLVDHHVGVAAKSDPLVSTLPSAPAFSLSGLGDDFAFVTGGQFVELPSGQARLVGVLARLSDPRKRFLADLTFDGQVNASDPSFPPSGSPMLELDPPAYVTGGGPVDPGTWHYWLTLTGTLTGLQDYRGAKLMVNKRGPAFQCGAGANGRNAKIGVEGLVTTIAIAQPFVGPPLPGLVDGEAHLELEPKSILGVQEAISDPSVSPIAYSHAFALSTLGEDYVFLAGGQLEEQEDGTANLTGVIARLSNPHQKFFVDAQFSARTNPGEAGYVPAGSPHKELVPAAYVENGGPIDTNHWYYYEVFNGLLTGLDEFAGVQYGFTRSMMPFQVGVGANGKNLEWGGSGWLDLVRLMAPPNSPLPLTASGDINANFTGEENECATASMAVPRLASSGGHALFLNGIGTDFVFQPGGQFSEFVDGTASLTGVVARVADPLQRFLVSIQFGARLDPFDVGYPPPMSPKQELASWAYVQNGGHPIDTDTWHYYETTGGTLLGQDAFAGALYSIDRMGPAFQVGLGANGKNLNYGGSGWLNIYQQRPASTNVPLPLTTFGDINLDMSGECPTCAKKAPNDPAATWAAGNHAIYLPDVARALVFTPGAVFDEFDDGTAHLTGEVYGERAPLRRFQVDIWFSGRVEPGEPGYAPPGSPKKELYDAMYVENGGVIDTDSWHYYLYTDGFLTGEINMAGALLQIGRMGPAFQVGLGASGKNLKFGASGWLNVTTLSQPVQGPVLPIFFGGDINMDTGCP